MSRLFVSIVEPTVERAIQKIASLPKGDYGIELRVDTFSLPGAALDLEALRNATPRALMYTRRAKERGDRATTEELFAAAAAGFDLIDVEVAVEFDSVDIGWIPGISSFLGSWGEKVVLSYHDWEGVPEFLDEIVDQLTAWQYKLALTPKNFDDNLRILRTLQRVNAGRGTTIFGMSATGLYSRILAPFFGSDLIFVAADAESVAAPGQLTLADAVQIFGDPSLLRPPDSIFAVIGSPAAHSRSPLLHNPVFRERNLMVAYTIIDTADAERVFKGLAAGEELLPRGLSITAPFKERAFAFAQEQGAAMSTRAMRARAVNTLVRMPDNSLQADNTDVAAFQSLLSGSEARSAVVLGAGGTARAALVALELLDVPATIVNRTEAKGAALAAEFGAVTASMDAAASAEASIVIDTLPASANVALPTQLTRHATLLVCDYSSATQREAARIITGVELLEAQAAGQRTLFLSAVERDVRR